jgi:hypothetical protein
VPACGKQDIAQARIGANLGTARAQLGTALERAHTPGTNSPEVTFLTRRLTAVVASTWGSRCAPWMGACVMSTLTRWLLRSQGAWGQSCTCH